MVANFLEGLRRTGPVTNIAGAGNANAQAIFLVSVSAIMVGVKTLVLRRLKVRNNNAGNTWVHIGTGAAGAVVDIIPALYSIGNTTDDYDEWELPTVEVAANIMCYVDAVGAGSFDVQVEIEERG